MLQRIFKCVNAIGLCFWSLFWLAIALHDEHQRGMSSGWHWRTLGLGQQQAWNDVVAVDYVQEGVLPLKALYLVAQDVIAHEGGPEGCAHDLLRPTLLPARGQQPCLEDAV